MLGRARRSQWDGRGRTDDHARLRSRLPHVVCRRVALQGRSLPHMPPPNSGGRSAAAAKAVGARWVRGSRELTVDVNSHARQPAPHDACHDGGCPRGAMQHTHPLAFRVGLAHRCAPMFGRSLFRARLFSLPHLALGLTGSGHVIRLRPTLASPDDLGCRRHLCGGVALPLALHRCGPACARDQRAIPRLPHGAHLPSAAGDTLLLGRIWFISHHSALARLRHRDGGAFTYSPVLM